MQLDAIDGRTRADIGGSTLNRARCGMRHLLEWIGRAGSDDCRIRRGLKY